MIVGGEISDADRGGSEIYTGVNRNNVAKHDHHVLAKSAHNSKGNDYHHWSDVEAAHIEDKKKVARKERKEELRHENRVQRREFVGPEDRAMGEVDRHPALQHALQKARAALGLKKK